MARQDVGARGVKSDSLAVEGRILALIASGAARSRLELADLADLSRSTIAERLNALLRDGFVEERVETASARGRPTRRLEIDKRFAVVLAADIGETHAHLAVTDLSAAILAETSASLDLRRGPEATLAWMLAEFDRLLARLRRGRDEALGVGLGLPAQIDFEAGRVVGPSLMVGWEDFDIRGWLAQRLDAPVAVENEVNLMAIAEHHQFWRDIDHLFFVKAGTGVGSGIIANGRIYRGARGAAGEIAHIQVNSVDGPLCRCGKLGCVEARASGWALARDLRRLDIAADTARDIVGLVAAGSPEAIRRVREAGRVLGKVIADIGCVLNPSAIVVGGALARADGHLMGGLRELLYQRSLPLATRGLIVETAKANPETSVLLGAARVVIEAELGAERAAQTLRRHARTGRAPALGEALASTA